MQNILRTYLDMKNIFARCGLQLLIIDNKPTTVLISTLRLAISKDSLGDFWLRHPNSGFSEVNATVSVNKVMISLF